MHDLLWLSGKKKIYFRLFVSCEACSRRERLESLAGAGVTAARDHHNPPRELHQHQHPRPPVWCGVGSGPTCSYTCSVRSLPRPLPLFYLYLPVSLLPGITTLIYFPGIATSRFLSDTATSQYHNSTITTPLSILFYFSSLTSYTNHPHC